ncbi:MAG: hypothetical protein C4584_02350 [Armatimonadetes bacterium]|nr:MAG: hypothetical protein C4584_02350 [Armatimonadota bacterium]
MSDSGDYPILIRARILFSNSSQPIAVEPYDKGGSNSSLPFQAQVYRSTGSAGNTQRVIQVFRQDAVVPHFFDYVLFSAGDLEK